MDQAAGPDVLAEIHEEWANAVKKLPLAYRGVAVLLHNRHTHQEIATMFGISVRSVERIVALLKKNMGLDVKPGEWR